MALLLANDKALLAGVLDLVLPRLLDQMKTDRRMAMVQGCDRSCKLTIRCATSHMSSVGSSALASEHS